jgi:hypothetical protein
MTRPNPLHRDQTTAAERLQEIAETLALGLIRLQARSVEQAAKSSQLSANCGESSLHFSPDQSGRGIPPIKAQEGP